MKPKFSASSHRPSTTNKSACSSYRRGCLLSLGALTLLGSQSTQAANATWNGTTNGNWLTGTNWSAATPGSGNTATFSGAGNGFTSISLGGGVTIGNIVFDTATAAAYTIGSSGQTLTLNDAGAITVNSSVTTNQSINADIVLGTSAAAAAYGFTNNSATNGQLLTIAGDISSGKSNTNAIKTLTLSGSANGLVSGIIAGNGSGNGSNTTATVALTKSGVGTWTLSGTNTYTGVTTISGGVLSVATIGNGGASSNLGAAAVAAANLVIGNGTLQYTGATASTNRAFTITAAQTATFDITTNNLTVSGASANTSGALTKIGAGTLTLSGTNAFTGLTTVTAGTLAYGVNSALSSGDVTVNGGTLALSTFSDTVGAVTLSSGSITGTGTLTGTSYSLTGSGSVSAILAGAVNLTKTGSGTATLSAINTYTGTTVITGSGSTLVGTSADRSFGTNLSGISVGGGAVLSLRNDSTVSFTNGTSAYNIANSANGATIDVDRVSGTGSNTITVGNLTTTSTAVTWGLNFTGANGVSLNAGSLTTPTAAAGSHTINNGIAGGGILTLASVAGGGTGANATLIFAGTGNTMVTGAITQAATAQSLTKNSTGTLTLSGTNTYTGITSINDGTLVVNGSTAVGSAVNVASIAKLFGTGTIGGSTTILGTQSSGASSGATGTQTFSGSLTYSTGSIFEWDINVVSGVDTHDHVVANSLSGSGAVFKIVGSGDGFAAGFWNTNQNWSASDLFGITNVNLATIFSGANTTFNANPTEGSFSFTSIGSGTNNNLKWTAVPEPTSALAGILLGAGLLRRKRDQRRSA